MSEVSELIEVMHLAAQLKNKLEELGMPNGPNAAVAAAAACLDAFGLPYDSVARVMAGENMILPPHLQPGADNGEA